MQLQGDIAVDLEIIELLPLFGRCMVKVFSLVQIRLQADAMFRNSCDVQSRAKSSFNPIRYLWWHPKIL